MAIVVAVRPGHPNGAALALAGVLAAALGEPVVAAAVIVVPAGLPSPLRDGMTDADYFDLIAVDAMNEARAVLGDALTATAAFGARSVRAGLLDVVGRRQATHLVLGSAAEGGTPGRTHVGSVASGLLHAAGVPVHIAPAGYERAFESAPVRRITVAFGSGDGSRQALAYGARLAERADTMLRAATFFVRELSTASLMASQGYGSQIAKAWHEQMQATLDGAVRDLSALDLPSRFVTTEFGDGTSWREALDAVDWVPGELMIVGSRPRGGPVRTFLGSSAAQILSESPVPVMVLPG